MKIMLLITEENTMLDGIWKAFLIGLVLCLGAGVGANADDLAKNEELGIETNNGPTSHFMAPRGTFHRAGGVLLIPESTNDTVGMYDPYDGTYLGDLINGSGVLSLPINAILGPDGNIYVSDQSNDGVFVFDTNGTYLYTYCDSTDGLDNVRGIHFLGGDLLVTTYYGEIARFTGPHTRIADFYYDGSSSLWDVTFLATGEALVSNSSLDEVSLHSATGAYLSTVIPATFPEQFIEDPDLPGAFLVNAFTDKTVYDFESNGTLVSSTYHGASGRGVYRLGNGNLLITSGLGVEEIDPVTGAVIQTENGGVSARFIELFDSETLIADTDTLSATTGGAVNFDLDAGAGQAGRNYLLFGGVTGTTPGTTLPGGTNLPVNWDVFTNLVIVMVNTAPFSGFLGQLDANGQAQAKFDTLGPLSASGFAFSFAFALNNPWDFASNSVTVDVIP